MLWPTAAICFALAAWYAVYFLALQPKTGTLEWIQCYDHRPLFFPEMQTDLSRWDALWSVGCAAIAGGLGVLNRFEVQGTLWLETVLCPAVSAAVLYLLARELTGQRCLCALCVITVGTCRTLSPATAPLAISGLSLLLWMRRRPEAGFWLSLLAMIGTLAGFATAVALEPASVMVASAGVGLFILTLIQRWHTGLYSAAKVWRAVLLLLLGTAFFAVLAVTGMAVWDGSVSVAQISNAPTAFIAEAAAFAGQKLCGAFTLLSVTRAVDGLREFAVWIPTLTVFIALLIQAFQRQSEAALWLAVVLASLLLCWLFTGSMLILAVGLVGISTVCTRLWKRGIKWLAILQPAGILALQMAMLWIT